MQNRFYIVNQNVLNENGTPKDRRIMGPYITAGEATRVFDYFKEKLRGLKRPVNGCLETTIEIVTATGNETGESLDTHYYYYDNK